ncbi:MAG: HAD-IC family P-type ATPase [Acidimicrobiia bacterium]|nr:HAD-IC family P-type ATPase [Acidimicrobiia bacterium]MYB74020.1 HAD-IC family P-type ATPase [Acidimicrobiia bacterium]MYH98737.1 HAD-IC family P-type ATPase [Acidimicrobiia bacterium]
MDSDSAPNQVADVEPARGLTAAQVAERVAAGRTNQVPDAPVRTLPQILRANVFSPVNGIMLALFAAILVAGFPRDGLFVGVVVSNAVIGVAQEIRAKRELDRLAVLSAPKARVVRDGEVSEVGVSEVVADEVLELTPGDQVVVDGEVLTSSGLEADESLLTGEADPIEKDPGDELLSGSFVAAGSGRYQATRIGAESYASSLSEEARRFTLVNSELRRGIDTVLRWLIVIIPPASALLILVLLDTEDRWQNAMQGTVAAAVAMVPDGLVLLTSLSFVAGVIALARRRALAKELATVELLARTDVLCLDKTGTITTGHISFGAVESLPGVDPALVATALGAMAHADEAPNATMLAVRDAYPAPAGDDSGGWRPVGATPFSSARKWSAMEFRSHGAFYFGAPDVIAGDLPDVMNRVAGHAEAGRRTLLLARSPEPLADETLPESRTPLALILLEDTIRPDAPEILAFFREQGVNLKVISGDHTATVAAVAQRAGIPNAHHHMDARDLPEDTEEMAAVLAENAVFGRVTPQQKRTMVDALQSRGHTVAMTGDGVNDVLALKNADMGIAMGSGSASTRAVAQLVLLDNSFATLPEVLAQGRKVINNVERVANLFVTKAAYAVLLTVLVGIFTVEYPFLPRHLTLVGTFSIGVPGIFLALAPSTELIRPGFLSRVLRFSIPAGALAAVASFFVYEIARRHEEVTLPEARTVATFTLLGVGLVILVVISRPLRPWKIGLAAAMGGSYLIVMVWPWARNFFELDVPPGWMWIPTIAAVVIAGAGVFTIPRALRRYQDQ